MPPRRQRYQCQRRREHAVAACVVAERRMMPACERAKIRDACDAEKRTAAIGARTRSAAASVAAPRPHGAAKKPSAAQEGAAGRRERPGIESCRKQRAGACSECRRKHRAQFAEHVDWSTVHRGRASAPEKSRGDRCGEESSHGDEGSEEHPRRDGGRERTPAEAVAAAASECSTSAQLRRSAHASSTPENRKGVASKRALADAASATRASSGDSIVASAIAAAA